MIHYFHTVPMSRRTVSLQKKVYKRPGPVFETQGLGRRSVYRPVVLFHWWFSISRHSRYSTIQCLRILLRLGLLLNCS